MTEAEIPDYNIFTMCDKLNENAITVLNKDYYFRNCRLDELDIWKALPFDSETVPLEYQHFMNQYVIETYGEKVDLFLKNTLFVCDKNDKPIASCSHWKAYGKINTIQWFKTVKNYEGKGIGRALLSEIMKHFEPTDYPIYLHTQPGSFSAIKLYVDFGFVLLKSENVGTRSNDFDLSLPILKRFMPEKDFTSIRAIEIPLSLLMSLENEITIQF